MIFLNVLYTRNVTFDEREITQFFYIVVCFGIHLVPGRIFPSNRVEMLLWTKRAKTSNIIFWCVHDAIVKLHVVNNDWKFSEFNKKLHYIYILINNARLHYRNTDCMLRVGLSSQINCTSCNKQSNLFLAS